MTQASVTPVRQYRAFISYSHQDKSWAEWLHKALETYALPKQLVGQTTPAGVVPNRLAPIFRDRDELATAVDLGRTINEALAQSAALIVICSPRSATSRWVNEEVLAFKKRRGSERIFCLIVDGEPNASDLPGRETDECFAPALRYALGSNDTPGTVRTEPVAADVRPGADGKTNAKLKLIAGILDINFDALKRRELQRRNRHLATLAALALVVMGLTTALAITAIIARKAAVAATHVAERRQKQAEDLVNFMLGDLYDKLAPVQRLDILQAVDDQAMRYFQSLPTTDVTDAALGQRARALEKIGSIRMDQGHLPEALTAYRASLALSAGLANAAPEDVSRQLAHANVQTFIGMAYWRQAQLNEAEQRFSAAQVILQRAERHAQNNLPLQFQLSTIDNNIGHVLEARGRLDQATAQYQNMLATSQKLVAAQPGNSDWLVQLGMAHNNLGKMALLDGDLAAAVAQYVADDSIESALSLRDPKDNNQRENMLTVRAILGRTLALTGDVTTAMNDLQQAIDIAEKMRSIDPSDSELQDQVVLYSIQLARLQRLSGNLPAAQAAMAKSLPTFLSLVRQDPTNTRWQRELTEAQLEQSAQSRAAGQVDLARQQVQATLPRLRELRRAQPDDRATLLAFVDANLQLADLSDDSSVAQGLRSEALRDMQAVESVAGDPRLLALQIQALIALNRTADAGPLVHQLWTTGYRDNALMAVLQRQQIAYPINNDVQQRLLAASARK